MKILQKIFKRNKGKIDGFIAPPREPIAAVKMIRVYEGDKKGATAFFRNQALMDSIVEILDRFEKKELRVLFHSCSVGAEPYSFAMHWQMAGVFRMFSKLVIHATDIEPTFIDIARVGVYAAESIERLGDEHKKFFVKISESEVEISREIKNRVSFLPPSSFQAFQADCDYDVVFILNSLIYVSREVQSETIRKISSYNTGYLVSTAFHAETIKEDVVGAGYTPVDLNLESIHAGWGDRVKKALSKADANKPYLLPPFSSADEDYKYKYCSIFKRETEKLHR
jgi:hypothetical protein